MNGPIRSPARGRCSSLWNGAASAAPTSPTGGTAPVGSLVVAAVKHAGAAVVVAADLTDSALAVARAMGADEVRNLAGGDSLPVDVELVFEASGAPAALGPVLHTTARGGTVVQV